MSELTTKQIGQLPAAETVGDGDLFVIEQNGVAKKAVSPLVKLANGRLWTTQDVYFLGQVLNVLLYSSADASAIVASLMSSLESHQEDQGWSRAEINMLDSILDYVEYTDPEGAEWADKLIASLNGQIVEEEYTDANGVEF